MIRPCSKWAIVPLVVLAVQALAAPAGAQDPTVAPVTSLSADGRTVTGAGRSLSASQVSGLSVDGQSVTVTGNGFDPNKGVYVSLCVVPPTNYAPSPCGGGQDRSGTSGASVWVSSNPPDYAVGLPVPYGEGGSFSVSLTVGPAINDTIDCRSVRCAIVSRNDHTRGSDRSQDLFLPVTFGSDAPPSSAPVAATPTTEAQVPAAGAPADPTTATDEPTTTVEASEGTASVAEEDGGSGGGTALAIAGGAVLAAVVAVLGLRTKRRRAIAPEA